jgi:MFS family permease
MLFPFSQVFEVVCLIIAFLYLSVYRNSFWGSFRWFMLITVIVEIIGHTLQYRSIPNHWVYNLYMPIETFYKYYILYRLCRDYFRVERWLIPFSGIFLILYLYESINSDFSRYSYITNSVMSVSIVIVCCLYYYYFLKKEEYVNIYEHAPFWIITALFFFYLGSTACNVFWYYLSKIYADQQIPVRFIIFALLNFIMYGCWSYSFICKYRQTTSSS